MHEHIMTDLLPFGLDFPCPDTADGKHLVHLGKYCLRCGGAKWKPRRCGGRSKGWGATSLLLQRDGSLCWVCESLFSLDDPPTIDHVVPHSEGGSNALTNLKLAHEICNQKRANPRYGMGGQRAEAS